MAKGTLNGHYSKPDTYRNEDCSASLSETTGINMLVVFSTHL